MNRNKNRSQLFRWVSSFGTALVALVAKLIPRLVGQAVEEINKRLRFSLSFKVTFSHAINILKTLFILSLILTGSFGAFLWFEARSGMETAGAVVIDTLRANATIPEAWLKRYADLQRADITLFDRHGKQIYTTAGPEQADYRNVPLQEPTMDSTGFIHVPIRAVGAREIDYVLVSRSIVREKVYFALLIALLGGYMLVALLGTILKSARTGRKLFAPIYSMTQTVRTISAGALDTRIAVGKSYDELKELAETFNEMLDRLQASYEQQQRFVSDASHELRTPIAVIQGYANLIQRWGKNDPATLEESITAIRNEAEQMKGLVEKLLFLARADKNTLPVEKAPFDLQELIDEVLRETRLIDNQHVITSERNQPITVSGDRGLIKQTLRICVDNSLKFTPAGGTIAINSAVEGDAVTIVVADNGAGIAPEDLPHIFDRFYKSDKSRTRQSGGAGLGLSIAQWIVRKHAGSIRVESTIKEGTKIIISLPR